jgi:hypothetical protein
MTNSSWLLQHGFYRGFVMSKKRKTIGSSADLGLDGWNSFRIRAKFLECAYHRWEDWLFWPFQSRSDLASAGQLSQESDLCCDTHDYAKCYIQTNLYSFVQYTQDGRQAGTTRKENEVSRHRETNVAWWLFTSFPLHWTKSLSVGWSVCYPHQNTQVISCVERKSWSIAHEIKLQTVWPATRKTRGTNIMLQKSVQQTQRAAATERRSRTRVLPDYRRGTYGKRSPRGLGNWHRNTVLAGSKNSGTVLRTSVHALADTSTLHQRTFDPFHELFRSTVRAAFHSHLEQQKGKARNT